MKYKTFFRVVNFFFFLCLLIPTIQAQIEEEHPQFYVQSVFNTYWIAVPPPGVIGNALWPNTEGAKTKHIEAASMYFDGSEFGHYNIDDPGGIEQVRQTMAALRNVALKNGRPFLACHSFPRFPGFIQLADVNAQPDSWRPRALHANGTLWKRLPPVDHDPRDPNNIDGESFIELTGKYLDITNDAAVAAVLANLAAVFDQDGTDPNITIGPMYGYYFFGETKLTDVYSPIDWDEEGITGNTMMHKNGGTKHFNLWWDTDVEYSFGHPPKRVIPLYSQSARDKFRLWALGKGKSHPDGFNFLPADRDEFLLCSGGTNGCISLPGHVKFYGLGDSIWPIWREWVFTAWSQFLEKVAATITRAQAGNPDFKGCLFFTSPGWYSMPQSSLQLSNYYYRDANGPLGNLLSGTINLSTYTGPDNLDDFHARDSVGAAVDWDYLRNSPWLVGFIHESGVGVTHAPGFFDKNVSHTQFEQTMETDSRLFSLWMAKGALAKRKTEELGKVFGAFQKSTFFKEDPNGDNDDDPTGTVLTPEFLERNIERYVRIMGEPGLKTGPSILFTIANQNYVDPALIDPTYNSHAFGNGILTDMWFEKTEAYRDQYTYDRGRPTPVYREHFNLGTISAGTLLKGRLIEFGGQVWSGNVNTVYTTPVAGNGAIRGMANPSNSSLPFEFAGFGNDIAVVEAKVDPGASSWTGIGFLKNIGGLWSSGELTLRLFKDGANAIRYTLTKANVPNTGGLTLGTGLAPNAVAGQYVQLQLRYNRAVNAVTALVNGVAVHQDLALGSFTPDIHAVGLTFAYSTSAQTGTGRIDDFEVRVEPVNPCTPVTFSDMPDNRLNTPVGTAQVTFAVAAAGKGPLTYRWYFEGGTQLNNGDRGGRISGATSATLSIQNVQTGDAGLYRCVVSSPCSIAKASTNAELTTVAATGPQRIAKDTFGNKPINGAISGKIAAEGAQSFTWYGSSQDGGVKVGSNRDLFSTYAGGNIATLPIDPVGQKIIVQANFLPQSLDPSDWVGLGFKPTQTDYFSSGSSQSIWCYLRANGQLNIKGNGTSINYLNQATVTGFVAGEYNRLALKFDPTTNQVTAWVNGQSFGPYAVNVSQLPFNIQHTGMEIFSSDLHRLDDFEVFLGYDTPPLTAANVALHPVGQTVASGATASFSVAPGGTAPFTYQWQKNGVNISNGSKYSGVTSRTLQVLNAAVADQGAYRCVIANGTGSATSSGATLTLGSQPPPSTETVLVIADRFGAGGAGGRIPGSQLAGQAVEIGGETQVWTGYGVKLGSATLNTNRATSSDSGNNRLRIPFAVDPADAANVTIAGLTRVKISADIQNDVPGVGDNLGADWVALGFSTTADDSITLANGGQLWVRLNINGSWNLHYNGLSNLASGSLTGFNAQTFTRVELILDITANKVSLVIDGVTKVNEVTLGSFFPNIKFAGLQCFRSTLGLTDNVAIDNFEIEADALAAGPTSWNSIHDYYLTKPCSWTVARAVARGLGEKLGLNAYLATINGSGENDWIYNTFANFNTAAFGVVNCGQGAGQCTLCDIDGNPGVDGLWLGLYQPPGTAEPNSGWLWDDGSASPTRFWASGKPANTTSCDTEADVVVMPTAPIFAASGSWWDFTAKAIANVMGVIEVELP